MADQNTRGFRRFMLDPKSSVMTYIADNIPPDHLSHQQGSNGRLQDGPMNNNQQLNLPDPNQMQQNHVLSQNPQVQLQDGLMSPPLANRLSQSNSPASSPQPGYARPMQSSQTPVATPYIASNISHTSQGLNGYLGAQSQIPGSQSTSNSSMAQPSVSQEGPQSQYSSIQNTGASIMTTGQGPPQPGARRRDSPQSAPRLYHRMVLDYEITKQAFFAAKSQQNTQEMASTAYELESSSRRLWGLRYEHSWEFEGYSEAGHQAVYSKWQAEYEMWADTVLDIQDGQILADAANGSKYENTSMHNHADGWDSQSRPGFQDLNGGDMKPSSAMSQGEMAPQMPQQMPPQQQMPQLQDLSMGQPMRPVQAMQNSSQPQPMPPGSFPQNGPPPTFNDQNTNMNMPPQQRQQSPQPPQIALGQRPTGSMQYGPNTQSNQYNGSPNMQNAPPPAPTQNLQQQPNMPGPNMQQPNMQQPNMQTMQPPNMPNTRPGPTPPPPTMPQAQNRPPQSYPPQNNMRPQQQQPQSQNPGPNQQQQPPSRNGSQFPPMNTPPRTNPSPRPSQMPTALQVGGGGGGMGGNGR